MGMRFGFVSTFPPTQCGLATFTAALRGALLRGADDDEGRVVRLVDAPAPQPGDPVVAQLVAGVMIVVVIVVVMVVIAGSVFGPCVIVAVYDLLFGLELAHDRIGVCLTHEDQV